MTQSLHISYGTLVTTFELCRQTASSGGRSEDAEALRESARAIFRFERLHEIPKLREISTALGVLTHRLERANADLRRYASRRDGMEQMVLNGFGSGEDPIPNTLDLLALERICNLGTRALQPIQAQVAELTAARTALLSKHPGADALVFDPIQRERPDYTHLDPEARR